MKKVFASLLCTLFLTGFAHAAAPTSKTRVQHKVAPKRAKRAPVKSTAKSGKARKAAARKAAKKSSK